MTRFARLAVVVSFLVAWCISAAGATAAAPPEKAKAPAAKGKAPAVNKTREPSADEIQKMTDAAPAQARVKPEKPRRLLVFSVSPGYWHDSIPYGKKAAEIMGTKTGAYEAVVSDDLVNFEPDKLKTFDAVFFNNTNNEIFLPPDYDKLTAEEKARADQRDAALKKNFAAWLSGGKGLAILHAGIASFRKWPEFGDIGGARFDGHPLGQRTVTLKVDDPRHPLAAAFTTPTFEIKDEIYQVTDPYSRDNLRVLVSIDTAKTDTNVKGINRKDGDFGMVWVKTYGQGRVFYSALGHIHDLFWTPMVLQHWLDGLQFVLGDLKADTTPSAKVGGVK